MSTELYFPSDTRTRLVEAIVDAQEPNGNWCRVPVSDQPHTHTSVWTTAEALMCLQLNNRPPSQLSSALQLVLRESRVEDGSDQVGWVHRELEDEGIGVCVTADCIVTLLLHGKTEETVESLGRLLKVQLVAANGELEGWGFTEKDGQSRLTPTCWAMKCLMYARQYAAEIIEADELNNHLLMAVKWLLRSQYTDGTTVKPVGGWGALPGSDPNASSTALAIFVLLEASRFEHLQDLRASIDAAVEAGIRRIRETTHSYELGERTLKYWEGNIEVYGDKLFRGLGTPLVLIALLKAVESGIVEDPFSAEISHSIDYLLSNEKDGWVAGAGRPPSIFENSYWLLALMYFQEHHLKDGRLLHGQLAALEEQIAELTAKPSEFEKKVQDQRRQLLWMLAGLWVITVALFVIVDMYVFHIMPLARRRMFEIIGLEATVVFGVFGVAASRVRR